MFVTDVCGSHCEKTTEEVEKKAKDSKIKRFIITGFIKNLVYYLCLQ